MLNSVNINIVLHQTNNIYVSYIYKEDETYIYIL
jgi:hypothetical protein